MPFARSDDAESSCFCLQRSVKLSSLPETSGKKYGGNGRRPLYGSATQVVQLTDSILQKATSCNVVLVLSVVEQDCRVSLPVCQGEHGGFTCQLDRCIMNIYQDSQKESLKRVYSSR